MEKIGLNVIKTRPHLIAKFPHLDQILDLTLLNVLTDTRFAFH